MKEKKKRSSFTIKTKNHNLYLFDKNRKKTILCHPILYFLARLKEKGQSPQDWLSQQSSEFVQVGEFGTFSKADISYYYKKLLILEENGYFIEIENEPPLTATVSPEGIKTSLANLRQLTFEITDVCGLSCEYCGYGKFYNNYDSRDNNFMSINVGKKVIEYLYALMESSLNYSHSPVTYIGFYGGEPLLNFPFIKKMVSFINSQLWHHNRFRFAVTTNGILLDKYMDYLASHNFNILISLDGNEYNNSYRVYKNGSSSFHDVIKNVKTLRKKYPDYFKNNVNFNAVLHNRNSVDDVSLFFKTHFDKYPSIGALNTSGIKEDVLEEFWKTYANIEESLYNCEDYSRIERDMFIKLPTIQRLSNFIHKENDFCFKDYNELLFKPGENKRFPTGTCFPFSKKMFVTVNGKIMACERIGNHFTLGHVSEDKIVIEYQKIADQYNRWFDKMRSICDCCYYLDQCSQCIFYFDLKGDTPKCKSLLTERDFHQYLTPFLEYLENNRDMYPKIIREVIIE